MLVMRFLVPRNDKCCGEFWVGVYRSRLCSWCDSSFLGMTTVVVSCGMWFLVPRNDNCCGEVWGVIPRSSGWQMLRECAVGCDSSFLGMTNAARVRCGVWFLVPRDDKCCASARWLLWCALSRGLRSEVMLVMWFLVPRNDNCCGELWVGVYGRRLCSWCDSSFLGMTNAVGSFESGFIVAGYARDAIPRSSEWQMLWCALSRGLRSEVMLVMWFLVPRNDNCCGELLVYSF
jgi:hypothetical protein